METTTQIAEPQSSRRKSFFWPERLLGPQPGLKEINLVCWCLFVGFLLIPVGVVHWIQVKHGEGSVIQLHSDFVLYYGVGTLAKQLPISSTYNPDLQHRIFTQICPTSPGVYGVSPYPPFIPWFFSFLARLSFNAAYFLWMAISLALYCTGIAAAAAAVFPGERLKQSILLCFALAFYPFVGQTLMNGQLAAIAVCAVGLAIYLERQGHLFYSGLALGLLTYKPTLLLLILPMLLLTRRYRAFSGFCAGAAVLFGLGTVFGGWRAWPAYVGLLRYNSHFAGLHGRATIKLQSYLDFNSISHMVSGGRTPAALALVAIVAAVTATALALLLWGSRRGDRPEQWLAWAAALTWTLMLNIYVPIYDSVLVVIAVILTLGALRDLRWSVAAEWTTFLAVIIFAVSWITESFAKAHHVQLLTLGLLALGVAQLVFLCRAIRQRSLEPPRPA